MKKNKRYDTLMKKVTKSAECVDMFAHHEWVEFVEVVLRGTLYTGKLCDCGHIEITTE
tara:strand:+ start:198 stop:371 length:174 start_codon:yes stop_codon:yes gene_type:complete